MVASLAAATAAWPGRRRMIEEPPRPAEGILRRNPTCMCTPKSSERDHSAPPRSAEGNGEQDLVQQASSKAEKISAAMKDYWKSAHGSLARKEASVRRLGLGRSRIKERTPEKKRRANSARREPKRSQNDETRAIISETATLIWAVRTAKNIGAFEGLVVVFLLEISESTRSLNALMTLLSLYFDKIATFMTGMSPYTLASVSRRFALFGDFCRIRNYESMPATVESIKEYFQYLELRGTIAPRTALYYVYPIKKMHEFAGIPFPKVNISKLREKAVLELSPAVTEDLMGKYLRLRLLEPAEDREVSGPTKRSRQSRSGQYVQQRQDEKEEQGAVQGEDEEREIDTNLQLDAEMEEALQSYIDNNEMESESESRLWRASTGEDDETAEDLERVAEYLKITQTIKQWKMNLRLQGQLSDDPNPLEEEEALLNHAKSIGRKGITIWNKYKAFRP